MTPLPRWLTRCALGAATAAALVGAGSAQDSLQPPSAPGQPQGLTAADPVGQANLETPDAKSYGAALVKPMSGGVRLTVNLTGLPAGDYRVVLHDGGSCAAPGPALKGSSEIPPLSVDASGNAQTEVVTAALGAYGGKGRPGLLGDRRALAVLHGSDGAAMACGPFKALVG